MRPARAVQLVAQQLVGGAGGGAEAAVHALAQDGFGRLAVGVPLVFGGERVCIGRGLSELGVQAAAVEDAGGVEFALRRRWMAAPARSAGTTGATGIRRLASSAKKGGAVVAQAPRRRPAARRPALAALALQAAGFHRGRAPARRTRSDAGIRPAAGREGSGWPPQAVQPAQRLGLVAFELRRWLRTATGSTFSDTSHQHPACPSTRPSGATRRSPATFFITWPPNVSSSPRPFSSVAPST
jgi:hypothetical protein